MFFTYWASSEERLVSVSGFASTAAAPTGLESCTLTCLLFWLSKGRATWLTLGTILACTGRIPPFDIWALLQTRFFSPHSPSRIILEDSIYSLPPDHMAHLMFCLGKLYIAFLWWSLHANLSCENNTILPAIFLTNWLCQTGFPCMQWQEHCNVRSNTLSITSWAFSITVSAPFSPRSILSHVKFLINFSQNKVAFSHISRCSLQNTSRPSCTSDIL